MTTIAQHWVEYAAGVFWQSWVPIGAGLVAWLALRKAPASLRFALLGVVLVKLLLPPSLVWPLHPGLAQLKAPVQATEATAVSEQPVAPAATPAPARSNNPTPANTTTFSPPPDAQHTSLPELFAPLVITAGAVQAEITRRGSSVATVVFGVWLAIVLTLLGLQAWRIWAVHRRLLRRVSGTDALLDELTARATASLGVKRRVRSVVSDGSEGPLVLGLVHPRILVPRQLLESISRDELYPLLLHEVAHIRRNDLVVNVAQTLLQVLWFFHPGVWLVNALMRRERELACDDLALLHTSNSRRAYASGIMKALVSNAGAVACAPCLLGFVELRAGVFSRVKRIATRAELGAVTMRRGHVAALALAALVVLPLAAGRGAGERALKSRYLGTLWSGKGVGRGATTYWFSLYIDEIDGDRFSGVLTDREPDRTKRLSYLEGRFFGADSLVFCLLDQLMTQNVSRGDSFAGIRVGNTLRGDWWIPGYEARYGSTFEFTRDPDFKGMPDTLMAVLDSYIDMRHGDFSGVDEIRLDKAVLAAPSPPLHWWAASHLHGYAASGNPTYLEMHELFGRYVISLLAPEHYTAIQDFIARNHSSLHSDEAYRVWRRTFASLDTAGMSPPARTEAVLRSVALTFEAHRWPPLAPLEEPDNLIERIDTFVASHPEVPPTSVPLLLTRIWRGWGKRDMSGEAINSLIRQIPVDSLTDPLMIVIRSYNTLDEDPSQWIRAVRQLSRMDPTGLNLARPIHSELARKFGPHNYLGGHRSNTKRYRQVLAALADPRWPVLARVSSGLRAYAAALAVEDEPRALVKAVSRELGGQGSYADRYRVLMSDLLARHDHLRGDAIDMLEDALRNTYDTLEVLEAALDTLNAPRHMRTRRDVLREWKECRFVLAAAHHRRARLCGSEELELSLEHRKLAADHYGDTARWHDGYTPARGYDLLRTDDYTADYARVLERMGRYDEALKYAEMAAALDPILLDRVVALRKLVGDSASAAPLPVDRAAARRAHYEPMLRTLDGGEFSPAQWKGKWVLITPAHIWDGSTAQWQASEDWHPETSDGTPVERALVLVGGLSGKQLDSLRNNPRTVPILQDAKHELNDANSLGGGLSRYLFTPDGKCVWLPSGDAWRAAAQAWIAAYADTTGDNSAPLAGTRSRESISQVVIDNIGSVRAEYNKRLKQVSGIAGRMTVKMRIAPSGKVVLVEVVQSSLGDTVLEQAVVAEVATWDFGRVAESAGVTEIVHPFIFAQ